MKRASSLQRQFSSTNMLKYLQNDHQQNNEDNGCHKDISIRELRETIEVQM